jgi:hypothetical protein
MSLLSAPAIRTIARRSLAVAALALGIAAPAASAACPERPATQVFAAYGDTLLYAPVPGGDFATGAAGWTLSGQASVAGGALRLAEGASAVSPAVCVEKGDRFARAFAKTLFSGARDNSLKVDVLFAGGVERRAGAVAERDAWAPTERLRIAQSEVSREGTQIRLRFSVRRGAAWLVDNVHVDPRMR